jgi:RHS repeat-associated protein
VLLVAAPLLVLGAVAGATTRGGSAARTVAETPPPARLTAEPRESRAGTRTAGVLPARRADRRSTSSGNASRSAAELPPVLSVAAHNGDNRSPALCGATCFDLTTGYTTQSYVSLDQERAVTLRYAGRQVYPLTTVTVDATDNSGTPPATMSLQLRRPNGSFVMFANGATETFFQSGPGTTRLTVRLDDAQMHGVHNYTAVVTSRWTGGGTQAAEVPVRVLTVNATGSPFGNGWMIAGIRQIRFGDPNGLSFILWDGDGTAQFYPVGSCPPPHYPCRFDPPPGAFTPIDMVYNEGDPTAYARQSFPDGSTVTFDHGGRQRYATDRFGNRTVVHWRGASTEMIDSIVDPAGKATTFTYDARNKLTRITDPAKRVTQVTIDAAGDLEQITDPAGRVAFRAAYASTATHLLTSTWDARGGRTDYGHDQIVRLTDVVLPEVIANGVPTRPTLRLQSPESKSVGKFLDDATGLQSGLGTATNPFPRVRPDTLQATISGPRPGQVTRFALDRFGAPTRVTDPVGAVTTIARNVHGQPTSMQSPSGQKLAFYYHAAHPSQLRQVDDTAAGRGRAWWYNAVGDVDSTKADAAPTVRNTWNMRRLTSTAVGDGGTQSVTQFRYVSAQNAGRPDTVIDPRGNPTAYTYAVTGFRNTEAVAAGGFTTTIARDSAGAVATVTDPLNRTTRRVADGIGRDSVLTDALQQNTVVRYDPLYLSTVTDAKGQVHGYSPNALGWVTAYIDPRQQQVLSAFDVAGNPTGVTNRRLQGVTMTYDALDRPLTRAYGAAAPDSFAYDPAQRWAAAWSLEARDTSHVDAQGRETLHVTVLGGRRYEIAHTFDKQDRLTARTVRGPVQSGVTPPAGTVQYHYGAVGALSTGQLDSITDFRGGVTKLRYDAEWLLDTLVLANGVKRFATHPWTDGPGVMRWERPNGVALPFGGAHGYDKLGRLVQRLEPDSQTVRGFAFDPLGRLTAAADSTTGTCAPYYSGNTEEASVPGEPPAGYTCSGNGPINNATRSYAYDAVGNRAGAGSVITTGNRVEQLSVHRAPNDVVLMALEYDNDGNVTRKYQVSDTLAFNQRLTWDALGRLTGVATTRAGVTLPITYGYDAAGRRVRRMIMGGSGPTTYYLWDGADLVAELDGATGAFVREYAHLPGIDRPLAVRANGPGGATHYYAQDALGNVVGLTDVAGQLVRELDYGPFGEPARDTVLAGGGEDPGLRWKARERDATTGLYYMRARWYDSQTGRFVSEDPIGLAGGINPYVYADNDPVNYSDPFGLQPSRCREGYRWAIHNDESGVEFYCAQQLPGVTVTARGSASGFSANFGNPNARGGSLGSAGSGEGPHGWSSGGRGTAATNVTTTASTRLQSKCSRAVAGAGINILSDYVGFGAVRGAVAGWTGFRHASALAGQLAPGSLRSNWQIRGTVSGAAGLVEGQALGVSFLDGLVVNTATGPIESVWHALPISGSVLSVVGAFGACL